MEIATLAVAGQQLLGFVFLLSGVSKARSLPRFRASLIQMGFRSNRLIRPASTFLVGLELCLGLRLGAGAYSPGSLIVAIALLVAFSLILAKNLAAGVTFTCSCFGEASGTTTWWAVIRNGVLLAVATTPLVLRMAHGIIGVPTVTSFAVALITLLLTVLGRSALSLLQFRPGGSP